MLSVHPYFRSSKVVLKKALQWWLYELSETLRLFGKFKKAVIIEFDVSNNEEPRLKENSIIENPTGIHNVCLNLTDNSVLYRKIKLPANATKNIDNVVYYEFNKYFPVNADEALYSFQVMQTGVRAESVEVEIWAVSKAIIDRTLSTIRRLYGLEINVLTITNGGNRDLISYDILKANRANSRQLNAGRQKALNAAILILLPAVIFYPLIKIDGQIDQLQAQINTLKKETRPIIEIRKKILAKEKRFQHLINKKEENPDQTYIWSRITQSVSNKAILDRLKISGRQVQLEGKTPSVERFIRDLESDADISDVIIIGPVTTTSDNLYETMKIVLTINI